MSEMMARHAGSGRVEAIYLRAERRVAVREVDRALLQLDGPEGDHAPEGKRALTLLQAEHLPVIASLANLGTLDPGLLRRNIIVSGAQSSGLSKGAASDR